MPFSHGRGGQQYRNTDNEPSEDAMNVMTDERVQAARKQAETVVSDARKQAEEILAGTRKQARRKATRARVKAARIRGEVGTKASGASAKVVGAAGAAGLAAGYFLDPESGKRRRNVARDRARGLIRRAQKPVPSDQTPAVQGPID